VALMRGVPRKWELDTNFKVFLDQLNEAGAKKAELFITPECWLDGYAAAAKDSTPEKLRGVAQDPATSPYLARIAQEAKQRGMWICFSFTSLEDGRIFDASGLWDADGKLVGIYRKTHLQTHDLQFAAGDALPVWPTPWGPVGMMICADRRWPETVRTLRLEGARLILNPSYGMHGENNEWMMRTRSYENQCFIAFTHPSVGFVADPKGRLTAREEGEQPGVLVCDVDLSKSTDENHLRDRRPDIYSTLLTPRVR
jgi:N-carbamoylputrescine amidase